MNNNVLPQYYELIEIIEQTPIEYIFQIRYDKIDEINYGQFLQVSVPKVGEAPISVSDFNKEEGYIELLIRKVGKVTDAIFALTPGDKIGLRGPYGNGFPFDKYKGKDLIIIAGGSGVAPVRSMIQEVYKNMSSVKNIELLLGFKDRESILFEDDIKKWKKQMNVVVTLDKGEETDCNYIGLVTQHLDKLTTLHNRSQKDNLNIVIVGPPAMMKFTALEVKKYEIQDENIWLSFERNMSCAVGKCGHCRINETYVCLKGPIFNYEKAKSLID
ncbi:anaerobic sulfite reductase subunit AsrB [Clostridium sp. LP20]|uniref:anaerobic sulfite reductase subunit AsrB n=1 Tax=Clostridium sp. LP20 TaxID=3418665 RepID=UPI003EE6DDC3